MAMSSHNKLTRKGSFEDFYYTEIVDSSKTNASTILSMQFAQMRENLANAGFKPASEVAVIVPESSSKGVKFDAQTIGLHESPLRVPTSRVARNSVPSHVVPKRPVHEAPVLLLSPAKSPAKYVNPKALSRHTSPSPEQAKAKRSPSPSPVKDMGVNPVFSIPERPELVRTLGTPASTTREEDGTFAAVNTFRGLKRVNSGSFHEEVHLHHDVFLATQNESIAKAVHSMSRRSQEVVSRYPDTPEVNYNLKPAIHNVKCVVPSHVVAPRSAERARSAPRGSSVRGGGNVTSKDDASIKRPTTAGSTPNVDKTVAVEKTASTDSAASSASRLTAKNLALNLSLYPASSTNSLFPSTSKSNLVELRISPTTVSASPHNSSLAASSPRVVIKSPQKKKFDFASAPIAPVSPVTDVAATMHGVSVANAGYSTSVSKAASQQNLPASAVMTQGMETRRKSSMNQMSEIQTPLRDPSKPVYAPLAAHTPSTAADKLATPSPVKIYSPGTTKAAPYRTLTAAEHAAAAVLSAKLNAANAAYHREETVVVPPLRTMSRALSQLVYNVRDK
eukprot:CAMPEP_0184970468 /NCGR_PEP_ID=MMETSP1098-20130426/2946_1 /TAXON_ID=89044 /ORGANISM="Spumella elongata, Strain CCAP 955/1" /LENGTH=561 /DNA_ID=CAMNT_0027492411 /DNA_START=80 /DNA_END=1765 /DNA_ORIENTATION=-